MILTFSACSFDDNKIKAWKFVNLRKKTYMSLKFTIYMTQRPCWHRYINCISCKLLQPLKPNEIIWRKITQISPVGVTTSLSMMQDPRKPPHSAFLWTCMGILPHIPSVPMGVTQDPEKAKIHAGISGADSPLLSPYHRMILQSHCSFLPYNSVL